MAGKERLIVEIDFFAKASGVKEVEAQFEAAARRLQQSAQAGGSPVDINSQLSKLQVLASRRIQQLGKDPTANVTGLLDRNGNPLPPYQASVQSQARLARAAAQARIQVGNEFDALVQKFGGGLNPEFAAKLQDRIGSTKYSAKTNEVLAGDSAGAKEYRDAKARETRARAKLAALLEEELASTKELAKAKAREATARAKQKFQLADELGSRSAIRAEADARAATRRLQTRQELATQSQFGPVDAQRQGALDFLKRRQAAIAAREEASKLSTPSGQKTLAIEGEVAAARARQRAVIDKTTQESLAADKAYIEATAQTAKAREEQAARVTLAKAGQSFEGLEGDQLLARAAVAQRVAADKKAAAVATEMAKADGEAIKSAVQRRNAEARLRAAESALEREYIRQAAKSGQLGGSFFQRLQARFSPTPRAPEEFQNARQYLGQKVLATAGYGIGATLFYGAASGISNLLQEATKLQTVFVQIGNQLKSLGRGNETEQVKQDILGIARNTGVASDEVAHVAFQFVGAFGGDTQRALQETSSAMKLVQVTGLELAEVVDSLTAISKTYNVSISDIGDTTLGLQERFGVLSKEIVGFVGDTAAVADEAKLSFQDLAAIGAIAQQQSGKSGATLAEQFNRILPAIGESKTELLSLYQVLAQGDPKFKESYNKLVESFGKGRTGDVFKQIVADFGSLSEAQRNSIISQLGGRREAQTLVAILRDSGTLLKEFQANESGANRDAGKLENKFQDIKETLANTGQRLSEAFKQIGEAILSSGLGEFLTDLGEGLTGVLGVAKAILGVFAGFNGALGGVPGQLLKGVAVAAALAKTFSFLADMRSTAAKAALEEATATGVQAGAHQAGAVAATQEAAAVERATVADTAQAKSSQAAAAANTAQAGAAQASAGAGGLGGRILGSNLGGQLFSGARFRPFQSGAADQAALAAGRTPGASGLGIAAIVTAGVIEVNAAYQGQRQGLEEASKDLKDRMAKADIATLQKIADDNGDFMERFSIRFFGQELPQELAAKQINIKTSEQAVRAADVLLRDGGKGLEEFRTKITDANLKQLESFYQQGFQVFGARGETVEGSPAQFAVESGLAKIERNAQTQKPELKVDRNALTAERIAEIKRKAAEGDFSAAETVKFINDVLSQQNNLADLNRFVNDLVAQGRVKDALKAAGGAGGFIAAKTATVRAQFEAGTISEFELQTKIQSEVSALKDLQSKSAPGAFSEEDMAALAKGEKEVRDIINARIKRQADATKQLRKLQGGTASDALAVSVGQLARRDLGVKDRLELLPTALEELQAKFEAELTKIKDPVARAQKAIDGIEIPPELQALLVGQQIIDNTKFQELNKQVADAVGFSEQDTTNLVVDSVTFANLTVKEALLKILNDRIRQLRELAASQSGEEANRTNETLNKLRGLRDSIASDSSADIQVQKADRLKGDVDKSAEDFLQAQRARARALLEVAAANAEGNPEAEAQVQIQQALAELNNAIADNNVEAISQAQAQLIRAQKAAVSAAFGVAKAQAGFLRALADGDPVKEAAASLQAAYLDLSESLAKGDRAGVIQANASIVEAQHQARDAANEISRSSIEVAKALAGDDPLAQARYDIALADFDIATAKGDAERNRAIIAKIQAQRAYEQALVETEKSRLDVAAAFAERDPLRQAQIALQQADLDLANARTETERNRALAARIRAQHQVEDAIAAIAASQFDLLRAMADYAGDTVEAARLGVEQAESELKRLIAQGAGEEAINRQRAAVIQAKAAARDAQLQDKLGDVDFMLQIGNITTAQAIQMLESLAQIPDLTQQQVREIQLKIKSLRDDLSRDFQFNLPTFLALPTLYEARRVAQGTAAGIGYQDNRTLDVQINVNGAQDPNATAAQVVSGLQQVLGGASLTSGSRRY